MNWEDVDELVDTDPIQLRDIAWQALTEASHFHREYDDCVAENTRLQEMVETLKRVAEQEKALRFKYAQSLVDLRRQFDALEERK